MVVFPLSCCHVTPPPPKINMSPEKGQFPKGHFIFPNYKDSQNILVPFQMGVSYYTEVWFGWVCSLLAASSGYEWSPEDSFYQHPGPSGIGWYDSNLKTDETRHNRRFSVRAFKEIFGIFKQKCECLAIWWICDWVIHVSMDRDSQWLSLCFT